MDELIRRTDLLVAHHDALAWMLVLLAGVATSIGPCMAPRLLFAGGLGAEGRLRVAAFVAGIVAVYASVGASASLLGALASLADWSYAVTAVIGVVAGVWILARASASHEHVDAEGGTRRRSPSAISPGAAFFAGAGSSMVVSPCCTPIVTVVVSATASLGRPIEGAGLLAIFALGHATPVLFLAAAGDRFTPVLTSRRLGQAAAVASGTFAIAFGCYYAVLV